MRSGSVERQNLRIIKIVDEEPVGFDVAFPKPFPLSRKHVRAILCRKLLIIHEKGENGVKLCRRRAALRHTFVVFLEGRAVFDPSHTLAFRCCAESSC